MNSCQWFKLSPEEFIFVLWKLHYVHYNILFRYYTSTKNILVKWLTLWLASLLLFSRVCFYSCMKMVRCRNTYDVTGRLTHKWSGEDRLVTISISSTRWFFFVSPLCSACYPVPAFCTNTVSRRHVMIFVDFIPFQGKIPAKI